MKKINKLLTIILLLILLVSVAFSLVACNKDKNQEEDHRDEYCDSIEVIVLSSIDEKWTTSLTDDEVATLDDAGEYIVTLNWIELMRDVIYDSSLQTQKIKTFIDFISSENGKKLISDFSENADSLFDLFNQVGFTSDDIASLVYEFVFAAIDQSGSLMTNMVDRITDVKTNKNVTSKATENLNLYLTNVNGSIKNFIPTSTEKAGVLIALSNARNGINDIVKFAYNVSLDSLSENIINVIKSEDGALSDITNQEIKTVIDAIARNITELKETLTEDEINRLNSALNLVIKKFDNITNTSKVFTQIVTYSKYAYMIVDAIPDICDVLSAVTKCIDDDFINDVKAYVEYAIAFDDETSNTGVLSINTSIIIAKLVSKLADQLGEEKMYSLIQNLYDKSNVGDYQKAFPLYIADIMVNINTAFEALANGEDGIVIKHSDILSSQALIEILNTTIGLNLTLDNFKEAYYNDNMNKDSSLTESKKIAVSFQNLVSNPYNYQYQPTEWYETYVTGIRSYLNEIAANNMSAAKQDLDKYVEEYYEADSLVKAATIELASLQLINDNIDMTIYNSYLETANDAGLYYIAMTLIALSQL